MNSFHRLPSFSYSDFIDRLDLYVWGAAHNGELGYGEKRRQLKPILVPTKERFTQVRAGHEYSLAISERGYYYPIFRTFQF